MSTPPPIPPHARKKRRRWYKHPIAIVAYCIMGFVGLALGWGAVLIFTAREFTPTVGQKSCVLTAADLLDYRDFEVDPSFEVWLGEKYIDDSLELDYTYDNPDENTPYINCVLSVEQTSSDAGVTYAAEWQGFKLGVSLIDDTDVELVQANHVYSYGDKSNFAFLETEGERYGFVFIARKDKRVWFVTVGGMYWEDPDHLEELLAPFLGRFETESF